MSTTNLQPQHLERLLEGGRGLVSKHDPEAVLGQVLEAACEFTGARYAALGILDDDKRELARFLTVGIDDELRRRIGPLPRGHGLLGELIRVPQPLRLRDISEHPRSYGFPAEHPPMATFLGVPVMIGGEVYGNLYLTEKAGGEEFTEQDEQLLVVLAEWAAVAIDNARFHAIGQQRRDELEPAIRGLEATVSLNREVGGETDLPRVLELVVKRGRALADARNCVVLLLDGGQKLTVSQIAGELGQQLVGRELPIESSPAVDVLRAGRGQRISGAAVGRFAELGIDAVSGLLVPLRSRGVDIGVLAVFDRHGSERAFNADDQLALESFATSAAAAIAATQAIEDEKVRLSIAASERERQRWARELHDETLQELGALNVMQESALQFADATAIRRALTHSNEQVERIITREPTRHTPELEATVYRSVQEALNNVVKHADASRVKVLIARARDDQGRVAVVLRIDQPRGERFKVIPAR